MNIPDCLVCDLRHPDRVGSWARWSIGETVSCNRVVHVRLVVGAVKVLSIPASDFSLEVACSYQSNYIKSLLTRGNGGRRKCRLSFKSPQSVITVAIHESGQETPVYEPGHGLVGKSTISGPRLRSV